MARANDLALLDIGHRAPCVRAYRREGLKRARGRLSHNDLRVVEDLAPANGNIAGRHLNATGGCATRRRWGRRGVSRSRRVGRTTRTEESGTDYDRSAGENVPPAQ